MANNWTLSHRADPRALPIADSHYNRQKVGSPQFVPPGRCFVLLTKNADALWVTSYPFAEYVKHAWAGAWVNSLFCNRGPLLSSELIREAVALTRGFYGEPPELGMISFVNADKTRRRRSKNSRVGECYYHAGFRQAICPLHMVLVDKCSSCNGRTKDGLYALQMLPTEIPEAAILESPQLSFTDLLPSRC